jgi:hypothetical protein
MPNIYELKKSILERQAELEAMQDAYALARARQKAAYAQEKAAQAAQAAQDMENVIRTRARKRAERLRAALENL